MRNANYTKWLFLSLMMVVLTACGGGGDNSTQTPQNPNSDEDSPSTNNPDIISSVVVDIKGLNLPSKENLVVASSAGQVSFKDNNLTLEENNKDVVALMDEGGQPILFGIKYKGDEKANVSLESSAVVFVLYAPRFRGTEAKDSKELSRRIKAHTEFSTLRDAIKKAINSNNPCPLDPVCNFKAKDIALTIASDLNIDDLYQKEKN